jgi:hypothetical protein
MCAKYALLKFCFIIRKTKNIYSIFIKIFKNIFIKKKKATFELPKLSILPIKFDTLIIVNISHVSFSLPYSGLNFFTSSCSDTFFFSLIYSKFFSLNSTFKTKQKQNYEIFSIYKGKQNKIAKNFR